MAHLKTQPVLIAYREAHPLDQLLQSQRVIVILHWALTQVVLYVYLQVSVAFMGFARLTGD